MITENNSKISLAPIKSESDFEKAQEIYLDAFPPRLSNGHGTKYSTDAAAA